MQCNITNSSVRRGIQKETVRQLNQDNPSLFQEAKEGVVKTVKTLRDSALSAVQKVNNIFGENLISEIQPNLYKISPSQQLIDVYKERLEQEREEDISDFVEQFPSEIKPGVAEPEQNVNYLFKIVNALDKINRNKFESSKLQGWLNDLQKQGTPTQQLDLFKEVAKEGMTKEEIAAVIAANYSYIVEINTATKVSRFNEYRNHFKIGNDKYWKDGGNDIYYKNDEQISKEYFFKLRESTVEKEPSDFYSNLTVPGGTNYTENEIATPDITPAIKGHAQFSSDFGIGWTRTDEKVQYTEKDIDSLIDILKQSGQLEINCK